MTELLAGTDPLHLLAVFLGAYAIGAIPNAYLIVKRVSGQDITAHGTGNVGAMNVRRTTGSWGWFTVAMAADGLKGFTPTLVAATGLIGRLFPGFSADSRVAAMAVVLGAVLGHNYSIWLSLAKRRLLGGKGLATGGGALLAYDWGYFLLVLAVGLAVIAVTRYMMAGQVAAAVSLPVYAVATGRSDWPFVVLLGALVYVRHHRRFVGLLRGAEPKLYVDDGQGPRG